jgi:actin-like ATPase involved in cell morphogenesis
VLSKKIGIDLGTSTVLIYVKAGLALENFEVLKRNQSYLR